MPRPFSGVYGRLAIGGAAAALLLGGVLAVSGTAAITHPNLVKAVPKSGTPNIKNGRVYAIVDLGTKVIVGGTFTQVANSATNTTIIARNYILSFDKITGVVDTAFAPTVSAEVDALLPGPTAGTVYIGGKFGTVNGVAQKGVALLNVSNGSLVTSFKPPAINGQVLDLKLAGTHLLVAGTFTTVKKLAHAGIAALNPTTGALDPFVNTQLTGHHNYNGVSGANAGVGGNVIAVDPDGSKAVVIGNFKTADGLDRDQVVMLDLTGPTASITSWETDAFKPRCFDWAFDSWIRAIAWSPDGNYFVITATGGANGGTICDTATRWEANATGTGVMPTWADYSGGDTILSVAITGPIVYVGGHTRWLNNSFGGDSPGPGAVGRASIAALDPVTGIPFSWNPGRNPRGYGVTAMVAVADGLWLGYDTDYLGNSQYLRQRIGFFPLAGGKVPPANVLATLPGHVYQAGQPGGSNVLYRVNSGGPSLLANDGGPNWAADDGGSNPLRNDGSNTAGFGPVGSIDNTVPASTPAAIFTDERWDPGNDPEMNWSFPVTVGKSVEVRLYLANRYSGTSQVGQRVFNVSIDGTPVLSNYDIVAAVGDNTGTMRSFTVTSDGSVDISFGHIVENPLIDGIEIIDPNASVTPPNDTVTSRSYDGATAVGAPTAVTNADATAWHNARGAFLVDGQLFYGMSDGKLYKRSFNGTTFGTPSLVDPYHDTDGVTPNWDTVQTGSGQTYAGIASSFYSEIQQVTGMTYAGGKLYYTLFGDNALYWRWFLPESGIVGADRFVVPGATGFADSAGLFTANNKLYMVSGSSGNLSVQDFTGGVPGGSPTVVSGPSTDGTDWRSEATFLGP